MPIDQELLDILACPKCKGDIVLTESQDGLICYACALKYHIKDDIPIMLIDEAEKIEVKKPTAKKAPVRKAKKTETKKSTVKKAPAMKAEKTDTKKPPTKKASAKKSEKKSTATGEKTDSKK